MVAGANEVTAMDDLRHSIVGVEGGLDEVRRIIDSVAQLLRDNQVAQACNDRLSQHSRQQIMKALEELRAWTIKTESLITGLDERVEGLEEAHTDHGLDSGKILQLQEQNTAHLLELLGLVVSPSPTPLRRDFTELLHLVRVLSDRDPLTGEPLDSLKILWNRIKATFFTTLAAGILVWVAWHVLPHTPWGRPR